MPTNSDDRAMRIRSLNDAFRRTFTCGRVLTTQGVLQLDQASYATLLNRVRRYDDFDEDSDPYGEHDFGIIDHEGRRIFWKIDYYDASFRYGSPDPADPAATGRVLTIMLAEEW
jgi:Protein of unknown function (DUF3768)